MQAQKLKIAPTKSALIRLRRQVKFLQQGQELLERKKELLTRLVYERLGEYRRLRKEARASVERAYRWLGITQMRMGSAKLRQVALGMPPSVDVRILPRRAIGVQYPSVTAEPLPLQPVGVLGTDASLDETRQYLTEMVVTLARLGEAEAALYRLLQEQRKTQKRVNALKYNVVPRYRNTIRYIESSMEEEERNTLFQIKVLMDRA
jgi:V/A-type H+-transporting ATPase subunit D